jgi:transcriptional regulator with XRE-family HTH domain
MTVVPESGPVVAGWLLGGRLTELRTAAGKSVAQTARDLEMNEQTVRRWENAETTPTLLALRGLMDYYGVDDVDTRTQLEAWRKGAAAPGWWNGTGPWPDAFAQLLGMEPVAVRRRSWDPLLPGLLQTPEVARLIMEGIDPDVPPNMLDRGVEVRMRRQAKAADSPAREAIYLIDEAALARLPGPVSVRRAQLARLLTTPPGSIIQVVPFSAGPLPSAGQFVICDFDSEVIPAAVYVEGFGGRSYIDQKGIDGYERTWAEIRGKALSPDETTRLLNDLLRGCTDD